MSVYRVNAYTEPPVKRVHWLCRIGWHRWVLYGGPPKHFDDGIWLHFEACSRCWCVMRSIVSWNEAEDYFGAVTAFDSVGGWVRRKHKPVPIRPDPWKDIIRPFV